MNAKCRLIGKICTFCSVEKGIHFCGESMGTREQNMIRNIEVCPRERQVVEYRDRNEKRRSGFLVGWSVNGNSAKVRTHLHTVINVPIKAILNKRRLGK